MAARFRKIKPAIPACCRVWRQTTFSRFFMADSSFLLSQAFAQNPLRTEDEHQHQHGEGDHILKLVEGRNTKALQEKTGAYGFKQPQEKTADSRTGDIADSAQDSGGERLDARNEAHKEVHLMIHEGI